MGGGGSKSAELEDDEHQTNVRGSLLSVDHKARPPFSRVWPSIAGVGHREYEVKNNCFR